MEVSESLIGERLQNFQEEKVTASLSLSIAFDAPQEAQKRERRYGVSIAYPKVLSKRYAAHFVVHLYIPEMRHRVLKRLADEFTEREEVVEHLQDEVDIGIGKRVQLTLYSPVIAFSEPVIKKVERAIVGVHFIAKPKDNCYPGIHEVRFSISDPEEGGLEYYSATFEVKVVDFAFDHISRPFLSNMLSFVTATASLLMFGLTLFGRIDNAFGLAAGTTAGVVASGVYLRLVSLYHRQRVVDLP